MKTFREFLQQLNEEPVLGYGDSEHYPESAHGTKRMGKIGPYEIRHRGTKSGYGIVHIMHNGESVGHVPYNKHKKQIIPRGPSLHPSHRGKKALVRGLMAKTYMMLADKTGHTIRSDDGQTKGGRHIWRQLAAKKRVKFAEEQWGKKPKMQQYDPAQHEKLAYGRRTGYKHHLYLHPRKTTAKA